MCIKKRVTINKQVSKIIVLLLGLVLFAACVPGDSIGITVSSRQSNTITVQNSNALLLDKNNQENLMVQTNEIRVQTDQSRFRKYMTPIIATVIYFLLGLAWLFGFGLLMLSIAPEDQPMAYISMLVYAVVVLPALIFSFVYTGRGDATLALRAALVPLLPGLWVIVSWILMFKSYA